MTHSCHLLVEDLAVARDGRTIFGGVSFRLDQGQIAEVTGPNGVGKSTLLRAVAGFQPRMSGIVSWTETGEAHAPPIVERLHFVGHLDGLKSALTAGENIRFGMALAGIAALTPRDALARVGLAHVLDLPVGYLSAGQRRRVALARLASSHRPLWLLDEPLTALDRAARGLLRDLIADHVKGGGMVLTATHEPLGFAAARELRLETA